MNTTERLPNFTYFDTYYTQQQHQPYSSSSPINHYNYSNSINVSSPPLTPSVSPLPSKIHSVHFSCPSTNNSTQPPAQQHKHVCQFQFCGWSFKRFEHLKRHMLVHTGERPHTCDFPGCGKSFSRSDNFHAHYRTHTKKKQPKKRVSPSSKQAKSEEQPPTKIPSTTTSMATTVAANAAAMVAVSQQFNTNQPTEGQVYYNTNMYEMNSHSFTEYIHTPFMSFDCTSSPMSPISPPTPSLSLLSHEGQQQQQQSSSAFYVSCKSHVCPVIQCARRFKRLEHLKRHMRIHTLEKPFCCSFPGCQKSFSRSDNLAQHSKTHLKHQDKRKKKNNLI